MPKVAQRPHDYITKEEFIATYGYAMKQCRVAELIGLTPGCICTMCKDGRLDTTASTTVLTESLYDYLYKPRRTGLRVAR